MELNGLPLHPLVVHAAVVFGPLAALVAVAYVVVPRWRDRLRRPVLALAVVAVGALLTAYLSGRSFLDSKPELAGSTAVATHQDRAQQLLWITIAFGVVTLLAVGLGERAGRVRIVLDVLLALVAVALLVSVALTGDAGARAVWG